MIHDFIRAKKHSESHRFQATKWVAALAILPAFSACVSYEAAPLDLPQTLLDLEALEWTTSPSDSGEQGVSGAGPRQLASFSVSNNPSLKAARAEIGIAEALLVEAGLLADPVIGWNGMDLLASQIVDGTSSMVDVLTGIGISIPLPRPGELDAKEGLAQWRVEELRREITAAEWRLTQEVFLAYENLLESETLLQQSSDVLEITLSTKKYFERALGVGAATAIQANLAAGDVLSLQAQRMRLKANVRKARQGLNALLGLPPTTILVIANISVSATDLSQELDVDLEVLVQQSLSLRPDIAALQASYEAAEQEVQLEIARQFPQLAVGPGIQVTPGFFTRFNRPAIRTAIARREALRVLMNQQVHEARRSIHNAFASLQESRRQLDFLELELLPNAESSLQLAGVAFDAREVTLLEILTLQRVLIDARTRTTEARAEMQRRRWLLQAASGTLLAEAEAEALQDTDSNQTVR